MAKSKLDLMYKKEQEEELKKKYGVKQTTPNVKIMMGRNEELAKALTGDRNFGSTVKDTFVKGVQAQANNQTIFANTTANSVRDVAQHHGAANAAYGSAYEQHARNTGSFAKSTSDHWAETNAMNSKTRLARGISDYDEGIQNMQKYDPSGHRQPV